MKIKQEKRSGACCNRGVGDGEGKIAAQDSGECIKSKSEERHSSCQTIHSVHKVVEIRHPYNSHTRQEHHYDPGTIEQQSSRRSTSRNTMHQETPDDRETNDVIEKGNTHEKTSTQPERPPLHL